MQILKVLFLLIVLVAVIEAQKGGTKRPRPQNVPSSPSGRKAPQPQPQPQPKPRPAPQRPQEDDSGSAGNAIEENEEAKEAIAEPPAVVPQTSFTCDDKPYKNFGLYADMEVDCSVYHMCFDNRKESFLCGTGTMFNQEILSCDHPQKVNCANSPQFYEANTELGKPGAEPSNDSGSKGGSVAPPPRQQPQQPQQPRPRIQPSKTSTPQRPRLQPAPKPQPFADDEPDDEPESIAPQPAPIPQPKRSKTSPPKPQPRPQPAPQPKKSPPQPKKPFIEQSYDDNEGESNVRRAYRARY